MIDLSSSDAIVLYEELRTSGGTVVCESIEDDTELELLALMSEISENGFVAIYTDGNGIYSVARLSNDGSNLCSIGFKLKEF